MTSEKGELKREIMKKFETKLDEAMKDKHKTLWELEEEVQGIKNEIGKELLENLLKLKNSKILQNS